MDLAQDKYLNVLIEIKRKVTHLEEQGCSLAECPYNHTL